MAGEARRTRQKGRLARGSSGPLANERPRAWIVDAVRARFPKLATAIGDAAFDVMLGAYLRKRPEEELRTSGALTEFLSGSPDYPVWYSELAALDRAHIDVLQIGSRRTLAREALTPQLELNLIPAHQFVELTTGSDDLWRALDSGAPPLVPRELDYPRTVLVWRAGGLAVRNRTLDADETHALRAVARGATLLQISDLFVGENPAARALDSVLRWIEAGVLAARPR